MNKCMETFKKIIVIILEIVLFITFCGVVFYFLFPEIFGKEKKSKDVLFYISRKEALFVTKLFGGSDEGK